MILSEEWRDVPGYEGRYQVSDLGNVRSIGVGANGHRGQSLKAHPSGAKPRQYPRVTLLRNGARRGFFVHVLVMLAFEGPPPFGHEVDHLDNDPLNPRHSNLEYVTRSEQQRRVYRRDGRKPVDRPGELNPCAVLTWDAVRRIRALSITGARNVDLARQFTVDQSTISHILAGRLWKEAPCLS